MTKLFEVIEGTEFVDERDYVVYEERSREVIYFGESKELAEKAAKESKFKTVILPPVE